MTFVTRESKFEIGERVLTTGLGGTFPPNLLVGTVSEAPPLTAEKIPGYIGRKRDPCGGFK